MERFGQDGYELTIVFVEMHKTHGLRLSQYITTNNYVKNTERKIQLFQVLKKQTFYAKTAMLHRKFVFGFV